MPTGRAIKAARVLAGLNGKELAKLAGIDPSTLNRLELKGITGKSVRSYNAVIKALAKLGVEIEGTTIRLVEKPR
jgi:transcriptional regulator with XRE-family HTH domain